MKVRELEKQDIFNGFLDSLSNMSGLGGITKATAERIFEEINKNPNHSILVVEDSGEIVSTTTLFIEPKFIHDGGRVGHIEDVSTRKGCEGKGYASALLKDAEKLAKAAGCYKVILNCDKSLISFYGRLGYRKTEICMRLDL